MGEEIDALRARIVELEAALSAANEVIILLGADMESVPPHPECLYDWDD